MSKVQMLRGFINERLSAAAEEIFDLFEKTIADYEDELSRSREILRRHQVLRAVFTPEVRLNRADVWPLSVNVEEFPPQQQDGSSSPDQEDPPELPHVKEEQEEVWSSPVEKPDQVLEEADTSGFPFTPVPVKSEDLNEEKPQSSQLHPADQMETGAGGEDCGGPEPAGNSDPDQLLPPAAEEMSSFSFKSETDDSSRDREETREARSGKNDRLQRHNGGNEEKPFRCSVCGKGYDRKCSWAAHVRLHSEGKSFSCSVCKTHFLGRRELVRHMKVHAGEKPLHCSSLTSHSRVHTREKLLSSGFTVRDTREKPFICPVCGKNFFRKHHLRQHLTIHTGEKSHGCSLCGKRFAQQAALRRHWFVHTGEKRFSCTVCHKRFTRLYTVKKHKCVGESANLHQQNSSQVKET